MASKGNRKISIDIVANDHATSTFNNVSNGIRNMAIRMNDGIYSINSGLHMYNSSMMTFNRITDRVLINGAKAVKDFVADSVNEFISFEQQHAKTMGAIASNYGSSIKEQEKFLDNMRKLKEEAINYSINGFDGRGSLYGALEIASAQTSLAKAGVSDTKIMEVLPSVDKFAGGSDINVDKAVTIGANTASIFGVKDWHDMFDKISASADMAPISVEDIYNSLRISGPVAHGLGYSLEEVLAMVVQLGKGGIKGSQAGTGIQASLTRTAVGSGAKAPTENAQEAYESYIRESRDANGKLKNGIELTEGMQNSIDGLNDVEKAWFYYKTFGLYNMKSGINLSNNAGGIKNIYDDIMTKAPGTIDKKFDLMMNTTYGKKMALLNAWEGTKYDVGNRLSPLTDEVFTQIYNALRGRGLDNIDYGALHGALNQAVKNVDDGYGSQIAGYVRSLGTFAIDDVRTGANVIPQITGGWLEGIISLLSGEGIGKALSDFKSGIDDANNNINQLPPDLQELGAKIRDVTQSILTLISINFATRVAETITGIYKATIGQIITTASMTVKAGNVVVTGSGGTGIGTGTGRGNNTGGPIVGTGGNTSQPTTSTLGKKLISGGKFIGGAYAVGEMTGINTTLLDKFGVDGKPREYIDNARGVADGALSVAMIDKILFGGAMASGAGTMIKKGITSLGTALTGASNGLKALSVENILSTLGIGALGGSLALVGGSALAVGGLQFLDNRNIANTNKKLDEAYKNGNVGIMVEKDLPWYDPNGIFHGGKMNVVDKNKIGERASNMLKMADYVYPDTMTQARPKAKNIIDAIVNGGKIQKAQAEWDKKINELSVDRERFASAQKIMYESTNELLSYSEYIKQRTSWLKDERINQETGKPANGEDNKFDVQQYLSKINGYTGKVDSVISKVSVPPKVNVSAPNVNVNVNVDKTGNVTKSVLVTPAQVSNINNEFRLQSNRTARRDLFDRYYNR